MVPTRRSFIICLGAARLLFLSPITPPAAHHSFATIGRRLTNAVWGRTRLAAGMDASLFLGGLPPTLLRVKMRQHSAAGPDMNPILGPSADPDPSFWLGDDEDE